MAKLTRTQKYAELRETLANDPESSLSTKELSDYEDRLNNITNQLEHEVKQVQEVAQEIVEEAKEVVTTNEIPEKYKWVDFEDVTSPIEKLVESFKEEQGSEVVNEPTVETNVEVQPQENVTYQEPVVEQTHQESVVEQTYQEPVVEQVHEVVEEKNINDVMQEINPFEDEFKTIETQPEEYVPDTTSYHNVEVSPIGDKEQTTYESGQPMAEFAEEKPEYMGLYVNPEIEKAYRENEERLQEEALKQQEEDKQEQVSNTVEQQILKGIVSEGDLKQQVIEDVRVKEEETHKVYDPIVEVEELEEAKSTILEEPADNHAIDHDEDHTNTFISDVMNEVSAHNQQIGTKNINQLTNDLVSEVRRSDKPAEEVVKKVEDVKENNEEFSNTISTEISRIMDEYETNKPKEQIQQPKVVDPASIISEPIIKPEIKTEVKPEVKPEPVKEVVNEHPVLTKKLEEEAEDVVEIKNIDDTDLTAPPMKDATTGTIPFVVAANEEEIVDDDFEEDSSNTVLNIILIVLIVILLAVLGLIVFYILKTKGII